MSTQRNKAVMTQFYDLLNERKFDGLEQIFAEDFVGHNVPKGYPEGVEGLKMMFQAFVQAFPDLRITVDEMIAEGDKVVAITKLNGTHRGELFGIKNSGKAIEIDSIDVVKFKNGKYSEHWGQADMMAMMRQLGVGAS